MKRKVKHIIFYSASALLVVILIGFTSSKNGDKPVNNVDVTIHEQEINKFTDPVEVLNLLNAERTDYVLGLSVENLDLKELERRVESHPFIKDAQVYKDIKGNLSVDVLQAKPIARIFNVKGPDSYVDKDGQVLPTTSRYTARVPILELIRKPDWDESLYQSEYGNRLMEVLKYIDEDAFWKAQIAQLIIEKNGEILMLPQVTKQEIQFGQPEQMESKFKKLKLFYEDILPNKGWNTYSSVNLKFKDQIICE